MPAPDAIVRVRQIRPMTRRERAMVADGLRATRLPRLAALRDVVAAAALAAFAVLYGWMSWPSFPTASAAQGDQTIPPVVLFALLIFTALAVTAVLLLRQAWPRLSALRSEARRLRQDVRLGIAEETEHWTCRALLLEAPDGWVAALLEDENRRTLYVEVAPRGHSARDLMATFPPLVHRFERALHSGFGLMETREGHFNGEADIVVLSQRPPRLPGHGTVLEITLEQIRVGMIW
jgi:hypothetical protein